LAEVQQAYAEGLVDESITDLEGIERDLAAPKPSCLERHTLIIDAIDEMKHWACFHPEDSRPKRPSEVEVAVPSPPTPSPSVVASYETAKPFIREPKVGRNDPCPCGSGKKYKKCCGKD
jgi:uncharacterized protein YecA (UPF0149 family)